MNKYIILTFLYLFKFSLLATTQIYYRPMSKKPLFGEDVCYYFDISDNSMLNYVKGCPVGKECQSVYTTANDEYNIKTCQTTYSHLKRTVGEICDNKLYECQASLQCSSGKCSVPTSTGSDPTPSGCVTINKVTTAGTECITNAVEIEKIGKTCETNEYSKGETITYNHLSFSNYASMCKKLNLEETGSNTGEYYIKSKELVDGLYSLKDGDYFEDLSDDYCESRFSLYFFGNGKQIVAHDTTMYKRCVTVLDIEPKPSSDFIIKYRINDEAEHIYDTSELNDDATDANKQYKRMQNEKCQNLLMPKLELLTYMVEEYKEKGHSNKYEKWKYLYGHPEEYLLYKDQTEVLDYLIQVANSSYIAEGLSTIPENDNTEPATTPENTTINETGANDTTVEEPNNQFGEFLNIQYLIILLFLLTF